MVSSDISLITSLSNVLIHYLNTQHHFETYPYAIHLVIQHITVHYHEPITIATLSQLCNYTPEYFIKYFTKHVGTPPYNFLLNYRMTLAAKQLLLKQKVTQVAYSVGYVDTKSFARAFKKVHHVSPSQYRESVPKIP